MVNVFRGGSHIECAAILREGRTISRETDRVLNLVLSHSGRDAPIAEAGLASRPPSIASIEIEHLGSLW
jgi:hypothetical protein